MKWALLLLFAANGAFADTPNTAAAVVIPVDRSLFASCRMLKQRLLYQAARSREEADLVQRIGRGPLSADQYSQLVRLTDRLRSTVPGISENNDRIVVEWGLSKLDAATVRRLSDEFAGAYKRVQLVDVNWESPQGYLPDDIHLQLESTPAGLRLEFDTNPVDACFGANHIEVTLQLSDGQNLQFLSEIPAEFRAEVDGGLEGK